MKRAIGLLLLLIACIAGFLTIKGIFPFIPIFSDGMEPALRSGSILTIKPVEPENITVGDIIVSNVPISMQAYYNYPSIITRRVIEIRTEPSLGFRTKGDNASEDPFTIKPADIRGLAGKEIPYLGLPLYLFQNQTGLIFIITVMLLLTISLYSRDILRSIVMHWRMSAPVAKDEERIDRVPTREAETVENKIATKEQPRLQPVKAAKKVARPLLPVLKKSLTSKDTQKHEPLQETPPGGDKLSEAMERLRNAQKALSETQDRLRDMQKKYKNKS